MNIQTAHMGIRMRKTLRVMALHLLCRSQGVDRAGNRSDDPGICHASQNFGPGGFFHQPQLSLGLWFQQSLQHTIISPLDQPRCNFFIPIFVTALVVLDHGIWTFLVSQFPLGDSCLLPPAVSCPYDSCQIVTPACRPRGNVTEYDRMRRYFFPVGSPLHQPDRA